MLSFSSFLQIQDDVYDLENVLHKENMDHILGLRKCSALIKLLPGNDDILVAHDTWSSYKTMLRIVKKYGFPFGASTPSGEFHYMIQSPILVFFWKELRFASDILY